MPSWGLCFAGYQPFHCEVLAPNFSIGNKPNIHQEMSRPTTGQLASEALFSKNHTWISEPQCRVKAETHRVQQGSSPCTFFFLKARLSSQSQSKNTEWKVPEINNS